MIKPTIRTVLILLAAAVGSIARPGEAKKQPPAGPVIRFGEAKAGPTIDVTGLDNQALAELGRLARGAGQWAKVFAVYVDRPAKDRQGQPPLLGAWKVEAGVLRFEPRFPLVKGLRYRAVFTPAALPGGAGRQPVEVVLSIPRPERRAVAVVTEVFPTGGRMPENLLRLYIHFSVPMSQGDSYRHVRLLRADGTPVDLPFLELDQELWDVEGKRFTLFFDPGRIKRGLKPREEHGPILEEGKEFTLVIDGAWPDADGEPMRQGWRRTIKVGPPDDTPPDPKVWKLAAPAAQTREPLRVTFPDAMDHALLHRMLWVEDGAGQRVAGKVTVSGNETIWAFTPEGAWKAGAHHLVADTQIEDVAGNSIGRPFEVDLFRPIQKQVKTKTARVEFQVKR